MTTSSDGDAFAAFKEMHNLGDDWSVRFTADEYRAREMAKQYRQTGHDVRVLPLSPDGVELDPDSFEQFEEADHDPLQYVETEDCASCLGGTHVLLTRTDPADAEHDDIEMGEELIYE